MVVWNSHVAILILLDVSILHARFILPPLCSRTNFDHFVDVSKMIRGRFTIGFASSLFHF